MLEHTIAPDDYIPLCAFSDEFPFRRNLKPSPRQIHAYPEHTQYCFQLTVDRTRISAGKRQINLDKYRHCVQTLFKARAPALSPGDEQEM